MSCLRLEGFSDWSLDAALGPISEAYWGLGCRLFSDATNWTHQLPYGRNTDRADWMQIFSEECGTCSTKHAALAKLCHEAGIAAKLMVVICKLDCDLDSRAGEFLDQLGVPFFPEAHCILCVDGLNIDVTFPDQLPEPKAEILEAYSIQPDEIGERKIAIHHAYLRSWIQKNALSLSFEEVWGLREAWIERLGGPRRKSRGLKKI